jgi:phenylalanyl-tRNA synthetase alpha chain
MSNIDNIEPPLIKDEVGSLHPINQVKDFLLNMLADLGFQEVDGPEIESEEFNFDMLNIKNLILLGRCMIPFMLKIKVMY